MRPDTLTENIRCDFTAEQLKETADTLAQRLTELDNVREAKRSADKDFNAAIERLAGEVSLLARTYSKGYEMRDVECDIRYNHPEPGKKTIVRMDTSEELRTEDMSWEEKQEELPLDTGDLRILPGEEEPPEADAAGAN
jgi:hypothetical protein